MARFSWWATDENGSEQRGECDAASMDEASERLRTQGLLVLSLDRADPDKAPLPGGLDAFAFFNRSLAGMTRLGLPLAGSIAAASRGLRRGKLRRALEQVEADVREGRRLDQAAESLPADFPPAYRWMLRAGAASGDLPSVLFAVARSAEGERRVTRAVSEALAYPSLVLGLGAILVASLLAAFGPIYQDLFRQHAAAPSAWVGALLNLFGSPWLVAIAVASFAILCWLLFRLGWFAGVALRRHRIHARLFVTLGVLLRSRVPLPDALPIAMAASGKPAWLRAAEDFRRRAREGTSLCDLLRDLPGMMPQLLPSLTLAEKGGRAAEAAEQLGGHLMELAAADGERLRTILAPSAVFVSGIVIGAIVIAFALPYIEFLGKITS